MKRSFFGESLAEAVALILLTGSLPASAVMIQHQEIVLDFRKPQEIVHKAHWSDPNRFTLDTKGLAFLPAGRSGWERMHRDLWIETSRPIGVGWSWRPVTGVHVRAEKIPPGPFKITETSVAYPPGQLYARFSPDAVHWSTWQAVPVQRPSDPNAPKHIFDGSLRVPQRQQRCYRELCHQYSRMDVPWASDEEAAVRWILHADPNFFARQLPFIGYVQFLYETSMRGGERLEQLRIELDYGAGGLHSPPKDPSAHQGRHGLWRFKAVPQATPAPDRRESNR